jgi:transposase
VLVDRKTVCPHGEVARPTLRIRGLLGQAEPILTAGGRAMGDDTEIFVGLTSRRFAIIAIADGERGGEVRFLGEVDSSEESMRRVVKR